MTNTKDAILDAAMASFTENGYAGTTIRGIARTAGVDPALVMHFFGTKDGLFEAALRRGGLPLRRLGDAIHGDAEGLGQRLVTCYLTLWEEEVTGARLHAVLSAAASSAAAAALLKEFVTHEVLGPISKELGVDHPETRGVLAGSHLIGVAFTRYVLKVGPIAELDRDELIACTAPAIQRYLTGDLPLS